MPCILERRNRSTSRALRCAASLTVALQIACVAPPQPNAPPAQGADPMASTIMGLANSVVSSQVPGGMDAFLPYDTAVAPSQRLPVDGVYRIDANQMLYRLDRGRVISEQDYDHFGLRVRRGMVVVKDLRETSRGVFEGYDLIWSAPWKATRQSDGDLLIVLSTMIPATMRATPSVVGGYDTPAPQAYEPTYDDSGYDDPGYDDDECSAAARAEGYCD